jgi:acetyl esterase/lipase
MTKSTLAVAITLSAASLAFAQNRDRTPPANDNLPATQPTTRPDMMAVVSPVSVVRKDVPYVDRAAEKQTLDLYAPRDAKNAPIIVYVHGGEWAKGDKADVSSKPKFFNENGVVFASVNYRLSGTDKHPAQVNDVAAAVKWLKDHAAEFGGDPSRVVLMGHSAGCHIVSMVGLDPRPLATVGLKPTDLAGVVAWSGGAYNLVDKHAEGGMYAPYIEQNFGTEPGKMKDASPMTYVVNGASAPPFIYASAENGNPKSRVTSDKMVELINQNGGHARSVLLPGKTHQTATHDVGQPGDTTGQILLDLARGGKQ